MYSVPTPATVWHMTLLEEKGTVQLAFGGECPTVTVIDLETGKHVLLLPVDETTFNIALTQDCLCYTNGKVASTLGKGGGSSYAWRDQPSYSVVSSIISALLSDEMMLLRTLSLVVRQNPAVVNSADPDTGTTLIQFVVQNNQFKLLDVLLTTASCHIGYGVDAQEMGPLHLALSQGKWQGMQSLLDAMQKNRFATMPGSIRQVCDTE